MIVDRTTGTGPDHCHSIAIFFQAETTEGHVSPTTRIMQGLLSLDFKDPMAPIMWLGDFIGAVRTFSLEDRDQVLRAFSAAGYTPRMNDLLYPDNEDEPDGYKGYIIGKALGIIGNYEFTYSRYGDSLDQIAHNSFYNIVQSYKEKFSLDQS